MDITVDSVLAMAPDDASIKAARGLASPGKWQSLGFDESAAWGLCQGSGSKPYQVRVDLSGPVCACSCPSRKIPCKHSLALLLLMAQHASSFTEGERPEWVAEWLAARQARAAKKEEGQTRKKNVSVSPKKEASRLERMKAGLEELSRWMEDQVRCGLSSLSGQYGEWNRLAARMVDAQAPGAAARLRGMESLVDRGEDWPAEVLGRLGELQLLAEAFFRMDTLSPAEKADVRAALGMAPDRESVLSGEDRVADVWAVAGVSFEEEDKLWQRRVWLYGRSSGRMALLLDFSHKSRVFEHSFPQATMCAPRSPSTPAPSLCGPWWRRAPYPFPENPCLPSRWRRRSRSWRAPWPPTRGRGLCLCFLRGEALLRKRYLASSGRR